MTDPKLEGMTGVILAGGESRRMGRNKALLPCGGVPLIQRVYDTLTQIFPEVILVTNSPEEYELLPCRKVPDLFPGLGAQAGVHAAVFHSTTPWAFVAACDMPFLHEGLIRHLATLATDGTDVVVPSCDSGWEPLHAFYNKAILTAVAAALTAGERRIFDLYPRLRTRRVMPDEVRAVDPTFSSFRNVNTPADYDLLFHAGAE